MPAKKAKSTPGGHRGRSKSAGRAASRSRSRTPARSRSRSKVTAKRARTPASESKARRRRSPSTTSSSSDDIKASRHILPKTRKSGAVTKRLNSTPCKREIATTRVSQRLVQKIDIDRTPLTERICGYRAFASSEKASSLCCKLSAIFRERVCPSPILAIFFIVSFLPLTLWLNLMVTQSFKSAPGYQFAGVSWPTDWRVYFDYRSLAFVLAHLLLHILLARFVPLGYKMEGSRRRYNGLVVMLFFCGLYALAQWCPWTWTWIVKPTAVLPKYQFNLILAAGKVALIASLAAYMGSRRTPRSQQSSDGNTGNFFVDFLNGRSVRPRWFGLDWKIILLRPGLIGLFLCELTYLLAQLEQFGRVSPALASLVAMHAFSLTDFFVFEYAMAYTFETRYEGLGYYSISGTLLIPFIYSIGALYLSGKPDVGRLFSANGSPDFLNCGLFAVSIALFLTGYWIYRASNNQKDLFRRQPNHPSFGALDKISGPHSQRLLAGGWWGFVRHPNYLGDLMMAYAQALPTGCASIYPWIYPLFLTAFLAHRIWRTEYMLADKYGIVMTMYKKLVPSRLIPRIF